MEAKTTIEDRTETRKKFDLDDVLAEELGQMGRYQLRTVLLVAIPVVFAAAATGEYVFTTARIPTRCLIPQCDGETSEFAPGWVLNAIPGTSGGGFDNCARYANSSLASDVTGQCPREWFDSAHTEPCQDYVYENDLSIVYDFGLACAEWKRSRIGSIRTFGLIFVQAITGYVSDRWGRRTALLLNAFNTAWLGLARSFVHSYEWFLATEVLESAFGGGTFTTCYILVTELAGPKRRVFAGATMSTMFALGQALLGLIALGVPHWRPLTQIVYAPQLLILVYFWVISESVRWLISKGRYEESEVILKRVALVNNRTLSDKSFQLLRENAEAEKLKEKPKEALLVIQVLKSRIMLLRFVSCAMIWVTSMLVYYGLTISAVNLSGNRYLNYVYVALVEIPGFWTAILLLDRVGRKPLVFVGYWLCAGCTFAFAFLPQGYYATSMVLYLVGKYAISAVVTSTYIFTAELYPTQCRHRLLAFTSMVGRAGSIAAPLMPALALTVWEPLPFVLFGSLALLSGLLVLVHPETLGAKLPDTMAEAEQLGRRT